MDGQGNVAYATSTGGISAKMPGRAGDSSIPGWHEGPLYHRYLELKSIVGDYAPYSTVYIIYCDRLCSRHLCLYSILPEGQSMTSPNAGVCIKAPLPLQWRKAGDATEVPGGDSGGFRILESVNDGA